MRLPHSTLRDFRFFAVLFFAFVSQGAVAVEETIVYQSGAGGYHTYRIPAIVTANQGTLLAFCEGRKNSQADHGDVDLLLRRSDDGGRSWDDMQIVYDDGSHTIGNPVPIVDARTGTIWLLFCRDNDRVFVTHSDDDGRAWSTPREITSDVKRDTWGWYASGPGHGVQLSSGRLLAPCDHREGDKKHSHVVYSDDGGQSWQLGAVLPAGTDECQATELADGRVYLNMRSYLGQACRAVAYSGDGGQTFDEFQHDEALVEPVCEGSVLAVPADKTHSAWLLFSNPADKKRRHRLTLRASADGGRSWPHELLLHAGPAAYSDLTRLPDGTIGCLYERGQKNAYETIALARVAAPELVEKSGD